MPPIVVISNTGPDFLNISQTFAWNIEEYLQSSKTFEWWIGEGPLFWYRIEWKAPICPPNDCTPSVVNCTIQPPGCSCTPPLGYSSAATEVWHVMATSVADLCSRLNKESCNRSLTKQKVFKKVQKYDRPVLCCDVDKFITSGIPITDTYVDVAFCKCECVRWVDPCDCGKMIAPCDDDVPSLIPPPPPNSFDVPKMETKPGFDISNIKIMKPQIMIRKVE